MKNFFVLLVLFRMSAQLFAQITFERSDYTRAIGSTAVTQNIPQAGTYFYTLRNTKGKVMGIEKVIIR